MNMNEQVKEAKADPKKREIFIRQNEQTILKITSKACGKYITGSDDEWSVALLAFNRAIDTYSEERGEFMPYAAVVIKRALIDLHRNEMRHSAEIPVSNEMLSGEGDHEEGSEVFTAVSRNSLQAQNTQENAATIRDEILEVDERLKKYGFSFKDLRDNSPKAGKTKTACAKAVTYIMDDAEMLKDLLTTGRLPGVRIKKEAGISLKVLDRYRRYIIMAVVILNGDYPHLADYLQYIRHSGKEGSG